MNQSRPTERAAVRLLVVVAAMNEALRNLDLQFPEIDNAQRAVLEESRRQLLARVPASGFAAIAR